MTEQNTLSSARSWVHTLSEKWLKRLLFHGVDGREQFGLVVYQDCERVEELQPR